MGDLPMYMAPDSADVWANKDVFRIDEDGRKKVHAGVPPDMFSKDGQDWGNPLYDWEALKADGYKWWLGRIRQCAERFDILRFDHFRGLSEYFAIPDDGKPKDGFWQHSAGLAFIAAMALMQLVTCSSASSICHSGLPLNSPMANEVIATPVFCERSR